MFKLICVCVYIYEQTIYIYNYFLIFKLLTRKYTVNFLSHSFTSHTKTRLNDSNTQLRIILKKK